MARNGRRRYLVYVLRAVLATVVALIVVSAVAPDWYGRTPVTAGDSGTTATTGDVEALVSDSLLRQYRADDVSYRFAIAMRNDSIGKQDAALRADAFKGKASLTWDLSLMPEGSWAYPLPGGRVISGFGGARSHAGNDIKTLPNDTIVAAFGGVVTRSDHFSGYGLCVIVRHPCGLETRYSHQSKNLVKAGEHVKAGQAIGLTGRTGRATTEHLHFETRLNGRAFDPTVLFDHSRHALRTTTLILHRDGRVERLRRD